MVFEPRVDYFDRLLSRLLEPGGRLVGALKADLKAVSKGLGLRVQPRLVAQVNDDAQDPAVAAHTDSACEGAGLDNGLDTPWAAHAGEIDDQALRLGETHQPDPSKLGVAPHHDPQVALVFDDGDAADQVRVAFAGAPVPVVIARLVLRARRADRPAKADEAKERDVSSCGHRNLLLEFIGRSRSFLYALLLGGR